MSRYLLLCAMALGVIACAGPMTSIAAIQERGPDGGSVRILCPGYPPDAATQGMASEAMAEACGGRSWKVVDMKISEAWSPRDPNAEWAWVAGYGIFTFSKAPPGRPSQQVDLKLVCVAN